MDRESLFRFLTQEGYPSFMLENTAEKIERLSPQVASAFDDLSSGRIPELEIGGLSYAYLVNERHMKPVGAILALDWLVRDPELARKSLLSPTK